MGRAPVAGRLFVEGGWLLDFVQRLFDVAEPALYHETGVVQAAIVEVGAYLFGKEVEQELRIEGAELLIELLAEVG